MSLPVFIVGGGGHAKVLIEALLLRKVKILGITESDPAKIGTEILGIQVIGNDTVIWEHAPESIQLVNGIGSVQLPQSRMDVFKKFKAKRFTFASVVHASAMVASDVILGEGAQIMAGAVIQPGSRIGKNSIVNTNASVDHDCIIGDHVHISPGVTLSGGVMVGNMVHIGAGATIIQGIEIGNRCLIAAGAVVVSPIQDNLTVAGVPAKEIER